MKLIRRERPIIIILIIIIVVGARSEGAADCNSLRLIFFLNRSKRKSTSHTTLYGTIRRFSEPAVHLNCPRMRYMLFRKASITSHNLSSLSN